MKTYTKYFLSAVVLLASLSAVKAQIKDSTVYHDEYRPQVHFSPGEHWMNDPNGMVYYRGVYHLFFQYFPGGTTWGPMHWGHAVSKDMIHWKEKPIALYPDTLGYIFSGSAVVDSGNTSGFGKNGIVPLVAIFTSHDPKGEKAGKSDFQTESLAYSLDNGENWIKFSGNPVLKNPGNKDFRDPKVLWYPKTHNWIMTLAVHDHVEFYASPDLKHWNKVSNFGGSAGAHGGVWECPDLFPLDYQGKQYWILLGNLNPGGPNGGSATQYFVGRFDGKVFTPLDNETKWLDYGPDEYAGVTWAGTGKRRIFLGWMSNWQYANQVPTKRWRNAMTIPRDLKLTKVGDTFFVKSLPVPELQRISSIDFSSALLKSKPLYLNEIPKQCIINLSATTDRNFKISLTNSAGDQLHIGFDRATNRYFIDRTRSGSNDFNPEFGKVVHYAPRFSKETNAKITIVVDQSSVELFADNGLTVMTSVFFPHQPLNKLTISTDGGLIKNIQVRKLESIWK
ncbi:MAG: glycoside hydrolase family 32 protein [Mucilaginibacter sp.]